MLNLARTLSSVLEEEFTVLESKDLEALEAIQDHKVTVLQQLDSAWSNLNAHREACLLYTSPSPRDLSTSRMPSSA